MQQNLPSFQIYAHKAPVNPYYAPQRPTPSYQYPQQHNEQYNQQQSQCRVTYDQPPRLRHVSYSHETRMNVPQVMPQHRHQVSRLNKSPIIASVRPTTGFPVSSQKQQLSTTNIISHSMIQALQPSKSSSSTSDKHKIGHDNDDTGSSKKSRLSSTVVSNPTTPASSIVPHANDNLGQHSHQHSKHLYGKGGSIDSTPDSRSAFSNMRIDNTKAHANNNFSGDPLHQQHLQNSNQCVPHIYQQQQSFRFSNSHCHVSPTTNKTGKPQTTIYLHNHNVHLEKNGRNQQHTFAHVGFNGSNSENNSLLEGNRSPRSFQIVAPRSKTLNKEQTISTIVHSSIIDRPWSYTHGPHDNNSSQFVHSQNKQHQNYHGYQPKSNFNLCNATMQRMPQQPHICHYNRNNNPYPPLYRCNQTTEHFNSYQNTRNAQSNLNRDGSNAAPYHMNSTRETGVLRSSPSEMTTTQFNGEIKSVAQWQQAHMLTEFAPSANKCLPLKSPIPSRFLGDVEKTKDTYVPDFHRIVNYPDYLPKNRPPPADGMRCCVMCGKTRVCTASKSGCSSKGNNTGNKPDDKTTFFSNTVARGQSCSVALLASDMEDQKNGQTHIIPRQNKGLCTACDVTVWVVTESGLEIKWCKGCKNFRPWAAFGEKGLATKCMRCRHRQREKYALQKEDLKQKRRQATAALPNACNASNEVATRKLRTTPVSAEKKKIDESHFYEGECEKREMAVRGLSHLIAATSKMDAE